MPSASQRPFALIRFALLAGVLAFGAVCWFLVEQRGGGPQSGADADSYAVFRYLVPALCLAALGAAIVIRGAVRKARSEEQRNALRLVGWAVGEGAALAGGVHYMLSGDPKLYVLGLFALLASFIVVPLREA